MWVPERRLDPERMDAPGIGREEMEGALADIRRVNRLLGGRRALIDPLETVLAATPADRPMTVLDVGTGGADLALDMVRHAGRLGRELRVTAVDRDRWAVAVALRDSAACPSVEIVRADAMRLPFRDGTFDVVTASMFLHHFDHGTVVDLLAAFRRLARRAVVVNDLRRHRLPWAFISLTSTMTLRHAVFRHDAPLSVLRGFTVEELREAGRAAGVATPSIDRRWPFRIVMTLPGSEAA